MSARPINPNLSDDFHSSGTVDIVLDDQSLSDSVDGDSNSQSGHAKLLNLDDERLNSLDFRNPKSHRLIEKRRRDRLNRSLAELLDLIPHKKPENHRRIEKIEIIEMAIKHMRSLIFFTQKSYGEGNAPQKLDTYRRGYQQGASDTCEFVEQYSDNPRLQANLLEYIQERNTELKNLTAVPEKREQKYQPTRKVPSDDVCLMEDENVGAKVQQTHPKVPSFVLHPSGTHYIPVCIDASIVAHAFQSPGRSPGSHDVLQCHPVSIPVNFHPSSTASDSSELEIQNINVIAARHQTSVRPN